MVFRRREWGQPPGLVRAAGVHLSSLGTQGRCAGFDIGDAGGI